MYDPSVGRFTSEDALGFAAGDPNLSRYVKNNPTNYTDPSGMRPKSPTVQTRPDPKYWYMDQDIAHKQASETSRDVVKLFKNLYDHVVVTKWVIDYDARAESIFTAIGKAKEYELHIYLGHGSEPLARFRKMVKDAFEKFDKPVKDGVPTGPILVYPSCMCLAWHNITPPNMRLGDKLEPIVLEQSLPVPFPVYTTGMLPTVTGQAMPLVPLRPWQRREKEVAVDGTINGTAMTIQLRADLRKAFELLNKWFEMGKRDVTVYVHVSSAGQGVESSKMEDLFPDRGFTADERKKLWESNLMEKWIDKD